MAEEQSIQTLEDRVRGLTAELAKADREMSGLKNDRDQAFLMLEREHNLQVMLMKRIIELTQRVDELS